MLLLAFNTVVTLLLLAWLVAANVLRRADLSAFDTPVQPDEVARDRPGEGHDEVLRRLRQFQEAAKRANRRARLQTLRRAFEALNPISRPGVDIRPVRVGCGEVELDAEWVTGPQSDPGHRLLYVHGGAFTIGSPKSHRAITTRLALQAGVSVLSIDYRLMPEHSRLACIEDVQAAWRWLAVNGPEGEGAPHTQCVAGDSAGGNLALMLIAWARDTADVRAADGALALSPLTDQSFGSPSLRRNADTDPLLGPMMKVLSRVPRSVLFWHTLLTVRKLPTDPELSPALGNLAGLPPVLVQASSAECLLDDARRYVNKAVAAGSPARLQTWPHMVHVWQGFGDDLPETHEAFERMAVFLGDLAAPTGARSGPAAAG